MIMSMFSRLSLILYIVLHESLVTMALHPSALVYANLTHGGGILLRFSCSIIIL